MTLYLSLVHPILTLEPKFETTNRLHELNQCRQSNGLAIHPGLTCIGGWILKPT